MKKKVVKRIAWLIFIIIAIIAIYNIYTGVVSGNQYIKISTSNKAYTNSELYVSIVSQGKNNNVELDTTSKVKLLDSNGKKVKNVDVKYDGNTAILSIPDIESGNYILEAKVSSEEGKDTVRKSIYISNGNLENITISLDKGIYKPGDTVNYRALLTSKENDEPISQNVNVCIYDGNDNKVYNEDISTSDYGIISGTFTLADEVNSGTYKLIVKTETNETTKEFKVNPYVTPKYEVKISYDKESYLVGETAKITINSEYFFGEAVQNASLTVYLDNKEYTTLTTDSQGNATLNYIIEEAKTYNLKVEAVDSSNYYVEESSNFTAGTDIFEIQLLPEYGSLVSGKNNDIYVFTNKSDGTPVKTYVTVSSTSFTKQVATDENGIGKFSIDISQINSNATSTKSFSIVAEDMEGNSVKKTETLTIEQKNLLLSTNKVKYEQGEDIELNISSTTENTRNIYFFKNDKLIKMLSTDLDNTTVNLDDTYGLVDIYVTEKNGSNSTNKYKKTIFINPSKKLNINISTDKSEYSPGENITISFNTTDENSSGVDAALLVSMLDNSVLSLADNDLSIDNIKLALQDIKFSDDLDGATLYSCIVNDSSEQTIMALLLKQSNNDINVSESSIINRNQKQESRLIAIISLAIIAVVLIAFVYIKFVKSKNIVKYILNFIMFGLITLLSTLYYMNKSGNIGFGWILGISTIIELAIYILLISKIYKNTYRTSVSIFILTLVVAGLWGLIGILEISPKIIALVFAIILLIFAILFKVSESKNLKITKYKGKFMKELIYIGQFFIAIGASLLVGILLQAITDKSFVAIPIGFICLYFVNYLINKPKEEKMQEDIHSDNFPVRRCILIILAIIGIFLLGSVVIFVYNNAKESVSDSSLSGRYETLDEDGSTTKKSSSSSGDISIDSMDTGSLASSSSSKNSGSSILDNIGELFSGSKNTDDSTSDQNTNTVTTDVETVTDDNIRNVFLESMCFIPELVTENGTANLNLTLSDNITTWTIQTIGNTKDGKVGYGILDNVKVSKEFFVDFELPKNLIETDKVSIPVTIYNYTDNKITSTLKITQEDWFKLDNNNISVEVEAQSTNMVYIPITILKSGDNKFRVEASNGTLTDIVEKECTISPNGYKVEKVVSTGSLNEDISEDLLILDDIIENTAKATVKIYSSAMSQTIEGMENIFKMPTGCFEQVSSSLYPNILALKYLEETGIVDEEIKAKALSYISSGYQKLLTYEVKGEIGGYSLYGKSPAETVLTAYGLMEITDLSEVYNVDDSVIEKMTSFLYSKQNSNGSFTITGSHLGGASSKNTLSLNAYITWALSESNPNDSRLNKSIEYLKGKLDDINDNYTLALIANTLANVKDDELNSVLKRLVNNVTSNGDTAYISSNITDYYGSSSSVQTIQTVALTSMALSKGSYSPDTNKLLINYLISKKDTKGTWHSTQATILALKALNESTEKSSLESQTITVKVNSDEQKIEISDNPLELYEVTFENLNKENKLNIDIEKGSAYYEVIEEYYVPYENIDTTNNEIEISVESNNNLNVNDILDATIKVINNSDNTISNGMVTIYIPQGFSIIEDSLMLLETKGIIEKYETSYTEVNIYLRDFEESQIINLAVSFRASYPVEITGMSVMAYDYYNPEVEGFSNPIKITVNE